jgi:hypothetical protein
LSTDARFLRGHYLGGGQRNGENGAPPKPGVRRDGNRSVMLGYYPPGYGKPQPATVRFGRKKRLENFDACAMLLPAPPRQLDEGLNGLKHENRENYKAPEK